ncbi:MAG: glutamate--cysteine ligase [Myxococcota bacterium]|nr:glutamate--cysteine ligase [Myxococcota bacterium]
MPWAIFFVISSKRRFLRDALDRTHGFGCREERAVVNQNAERITSAGDCVDFLRSGETPRSDWVIGTEHEKIGLYADTFERIPYEGERGVGRLLEEIAVRDDWGRIFEGENLIALEKNGASITLEPGGQIELSGAPLGAIRETCREFNAHVDLVNEISAELGIVFVALGIDPLHPVSEIPVMPKRRYEIMREYLPTRGHLGLDMMHASATVQANFDFSDEVDMAAKMRTAMGCTPIISALFANSSIAEGGLTGWASKRVEIWRDTDPDRCGLLPFVFDPDFGYSRYVEWALDVPMFFIVRDSEYQPAWHLTFRQFMEHGFEGIRATQDDWNLHLTTLFPEVRLKRIIEVRGADTVPRDLICALPAVWKGLLYDDAAREAAWKLVADFSMEQRQVAQGDVARKGLAAQIGGNAVLELARELVDISSEGLRSIGEPSGSAPDERGFLDPLREQLRLGRSPGEMQAESWNGAWDASPERLIAFARYS